MKDHTLGGSMDRLKVSYRKYRKPGERQKKDCYYMETSKEDEMIEKFDLMILLSCLKKDELKELKTWFKGMLERREK